MSKTLTIALPDEAYDALARAAQICGTSPEELVRRSLSEQGGLGGRPGTALRSALEHLGLVTGPAPAGPDAADYAAFQPLQIDGPPVSETLIAERR